MTYYVRPYGTPRSEAVPIPSPRDAELLSRQGLRVTTRATDPHQ